MTRREYFEAEQLKRLLSILDVTDDLESPVCVDHADKPDFILSTRTRTIGLETTCIEDEEVMRGNQLHFTKYPNAYVTTSGLRDGSRRRSNDEIANTMLNFLDTPWESVPDIANHTAQQILKSIRAKQEKFRSPTFGKFKENWLLLTDYLNPFADPLTDDILASHLGATLQRGDVSGPEFDRIYISYGPRWFRIQDGHLSSKSEKKPHPGSAASVDASPGPG